MSYLSHAYSNNSVKFCPFLSNLFPHMDISTKLTQNEAHQGNNIGLLEAEGAGNREDRFEAGEHRGKEDDLANPGVNRQVGQVVAEWGKLLI